MRQSSLLSKIRANKRMLLLRMKLQLPINRIRQPKNNYLKIRQLKTLNPKIRQLKILRLKSNKPKTSQLKNNKLKTNKQRNNKLKKINKIKAPKSNSKRTKLKIKLPLMIPPNLDMKEKNNT